MPISQKDLCDAVMSRATRKAQYNAAVKYLALQGVTSEPKHKTGNVDGVKVFAYLWEAQEARVLVQLANGVDPYVKVTKTTVAKPKAATKPAPKTSTRKPRQKAITYKVYAQVEEIGNNNQAIIWEDDAKVDNRYVVIQATDSGKVMPRFFATLGQARDFYRRDGNRPGIYKLLDKGAGHREVNIARADALNESEGLGMQAPLVAIYWHEGTDSNRGVFGAKAAAKVIRSIARERDTGVGGYSKTKLTILWSDNAYTLRLDVESRHTTGDALGEHLRSSVKFYSDPKEAAKWNQSAAEWKVSYLAARGSLVSWEGYTGAKRSKVPEFGGKSEETPTKTKAPSKKEEQEMLSWAKGKIDEYYG